MYEYTWLNEKLLFVQWHEGDADNEARQFLAELYNLLNEHETPFYILVDLRQGHIADTKTFSRIKFLPSHKNWSGSAAFHNDPISTISNTTFQMLKSNSQDKDVILNIPEQAIAFLELLEPGLTADIDWDAILQPSPNV